MGALLSQFLSKITRTKREDEEDDGVIDFLHLSRNLDMPKSVQMLTGGCFNCALFVVLGITMKNITGPALVLSIILGAAVAMLNNVSLAELCSRFQNTTSFYGIIYKNVGELFAFMVGWFRLLQSIFMISVVSASAGEYILYLVKPLLSSSWSPGRTSWTEVRIDDLIFILAFLAILSLVIAAGLPYCSAYIMALFWTTVLVFLFMFVVMIYYASSLNFSFPETFEPFDFFGMAQGTAVATFFFTRLDKVVEQGALMKSSNNIISASLAISLLVVFSYYLCSTLFVAVLVPFDNLSTEATIPKVFALTTFHSSKYILSAAAIIVFCLTMIESYFDAQKLFNLLAEDGLLCRYFVDRRNSRNWKKIPALSVFVIAVLSIPLFIWAPLENLILGFCITSLMISIIINCTAIIVQYRPLTQEKDEHSGLPNWESTKYTIIRFLLCFGYITHKRILSATGVSRNVKATHQTSKIVNWLVVSYIPSCIGLSLAVIHGLPVIGWTYWILVAALGSLAITVFLSVRIIQIQPRATSSLFGSNFFSSFVPLLNIGLFSLLLASIKWIAFAPVAVWFVLGIFIYFLYGISHSDEALYSNANESNKSSLGRVRFDSPPQLDTTFTNVQPQSTDANQQQFLFTEDTKLFDYPQKY